MAKEFCSSEFNVNPEKLARLHARELNENEDDESLMVSNSESPHSEKILVNICSATLTASSGK